MSRQHPYGIVYGNAKNGSDSSLGCRVTLCADLHVFFKLLSLQY